MKRSDASSTGKPDDPTFAGLLARRAGLRQVRFAVPARDYVPIAKAKRRFGTVAVAPRGDRRTAFERRLPTLRSPVERPPVRAPAERLRPLARSFGTPFARQQDRRFRTHAPPGQIPPHGLGTRIPPLSILQILCRSPRTSPCALWRGTLAHTPISQAFPQPPPFVSVTRDSIFFPTRYSAAHQCLPDRVPAQRQGASPTEFRKVRPLQDLRESHRGDSNLQPAVYKTAALPIELRWLAGKHSLGPAVRNSRPRRIGEWSETARRGGAVTGWFC